MELRRCRSVRPDAAAGRTDACWLDRYAAYAVASGTDPEQAKTMRATIDARVNMLSPDTDEAILRDGGFRDACPFFTAFTWHGWIGRA
jgi:tRNA (cmo5U34)-methyltransferase